MKRPTQKHLKAFKKAATALLAENGVTLDEHNEGTLETKYGPVRVHLYDNWCHFRINAFDSKYPNPWYGFRHWKYNFHPTDETLRAGHGGAGLVYHMAKLFRDNGSGYPTQEELNAKAAKDAEREKHWQEVYATI